MRRKWAFIPLALTGGVLFVALGGEVVRLLWNALLPPLFGWREVSFWQALGILVLCRILFGGFGGHSHARRRMGDRMAERVADRWQAMSPEDRERFRKRLRERCGFDPGGVETSANE